MGDKRIKKVLKELRKIREAIEELDFDLDDPAGSEIAGALRDILRELRATRSIEAGSQDILGNILVEERAQRNLLEDILEELRDGGPPVDEIREQLEELLGSRVQITVDFGTVTGRVVTVQVDYTALVDASGNLVYVPLANINSVAALEERG